MKILVTGFDPFGGEPINPAIESVKKLPDNIAGAEIIKLEIPTVKKNLLKKLKRLLKNIIRMLSYQLGRQAEDLIFPLNVLE